MKEINNNYMLNIFKKSDADLLNEFDIKFTHDKLYNDNPFDLITHNKLLVLYRKHLDFTEFHILNILANIFQRSKASSSFLLILSFIFCICGVHSSLFFMATFFGLICFSYVYVFLYCAHFEGYLRKYLGLHHLSAMKYIEKLFDFNKRKYLYTSLIFNIAIGVIFFIKYK